MTKVSRFSGTRFISGHSPQGFGTRFSVKEDGSVFADIIFDESKEGGPGILHGGAIAAVLDEAMGVAAFEAGSPGFTVTMTYNYAAHIPLGQTIRVEAHIEKVDGRKIYAACQARLADGSIAVSGRGIFVKSEKLQAMLESNPYVPDENHE